MGLSLRDAGLEDVPSGRTRAGARQRRMGLTGTRIPVRALFEKWFPGVTRDQVIAVVTHAKRSLTPA